MLGPNLEDNKNPELEVAFALRAFVRQEETAEKLSLAGLHFWQPPRARKMKVNNVQNPPRQAFDKLPIALESTPKGLIPYMQNKTRWASKLTSLSGHENLSPELE